MTAEKQRKTFLSYSRANKDFAIRLAKELKSEGFDIWLDQLDIPAGARWDREVERALRESEIFMIILTQASVDSENVLDEMGYAIDNSKRFLPVLLEKCDVPLRLRRFQYVDFTNKNFDEGVESAKDLLRGLIAQPTIPRAEFTGSQVVEAARQAKEKTDRQVTQKTEEERRANEKAEMDRRVREETERVLAQKAEEERQAKAKAEAERKAKAEARRKSKEEADRLAAEKADEELAAKARAETERKANEDREARVAADRLTAEKAEQEHLAKQKAEAEHVAKQKAEEELAAKVRAEKERKAKEDREAKAEADRLAAQKTEAERVASVKAEEERLAKAKAETERLNKRKTEVEDKGKPTPSTPVAPGANPAPAKKKSITGMVIGVGGVAFLTIAVIGIWVLGSIFSKGSNGQEPTPTSVKQSVVVQPTKTVVPFKTSVPTRTAKPATVLITEVVMAKDVEGDLLNPVDPTTVFGPDSVIHAVAMIQDAPANTKFTATFYVVDVGSAAEPNQLISSFDLTADGTRNLDFNLTPTTTWPPGTYRVEISVNGVVDQIVEYTVQ